MTRFIHDQFAEDRELIMRLAPLYQQEREQLEKEAEERGMAIAQRKFARNLLSRGMDVKEVAELTGLSMEEVTQLSNESSE